MFAGRDNKSQMSGTTKNYQSTQWSLNPSSYQNVENDQVDWATLAQQWIQMKDTCPPEYDLGAPPPPTLCFHTNKFEEKGEADMEMEKDDEPFNSASFNNFQSHQQQQSSSSSASSWKHSGWNTWTNPNMPDAPIQTTTTTTTHQPQSIHSRPPLLQSPAPVNYNQSSFNSANVSSSNSSYWNSSSRNRFPAASNNSTNDSKNYSSDHRGGSEDMIGSDDEDDNSQTIDAAKRKTLPVWIREGLEKMEREKLKEEQRERELKEREAMLIRRKIAEEEAMKELASESNIPRKSKFDSDSEDEDKEIQPNVSKPDSKIEREEKGKSKSPQMLKPYRTREELIQDMMMAVRKNLTEILLEVTNEEIFDIVKETVAKNRKKAPTAQVRKSALSSITGGLGLGIYSNSTDEDESSDSGEEDLKMQEKNIESDVESDSDLQESIKRRKTAFEKTSREIEAQLAEEEAREERKRREREKKDMVKNDEEDSSDQDDKSKRKNLYREGETTHDKNNMKYGRKPREKKPSRFSDPRDTVRNMQTHISMVTTGRTIIKEDVNELTSKNPRTEKDDFKKIRESSITSEESHRSNNSKRKKSKKEKKSHKKKKPKYSDSENSDLDDNSSLRSNDPHYSRSSVSRSEDSRTHRRSRSRDRRDYQSSSSYSKDQRNRSRSRSKDRNRSRSRDRYSKRSKSPKDRKRHRY